MLEQQFLHSDVKYRFAAALPVLITFQVQPFHIRNWCKFFTKFTDCPLRFEQFPNLVHCQDPRSLLSPRKLNELKVSEYFLKGRKSLRRINIYNTEANRCFGKL